MNYSFLLIFLLITPFFAVSSHVMEAQAIVRDKKFNSIKKKVLLKNLKKKNCFESKFFKIVLAKSSKPLCLDHIDEKLKLKAATTYYHLSKAREYFLSEHNSDYVRSLEQIVVRLDLTNGFHELGHFKNDNHKPQYNNALTIPSGEGYPNRGIDSWDKEIWFRPSKKVHISEIDASTTYNSFQQIFKSFRSQIHMTTLQRFLSDTIRQLEGNSNVVNQFSTENLLRTSGASILIELAFQSGPWLERFIQRKWYHLETALIPEIIYHEYAHVALSDHLVVSHSTPVIEGMADFFAGKISGHDELATHIKKYNTFSGKKADNKKRYREIFETTGMANTDFVFGLLWNLENVIGKHTSENLVYNLRTRIQTDSTIADELLWAVFDECDEHCENFSQIRYDLYKYFYSQGI